MCRLAFCELICSAAIPTDLLAKHRTHRRLRPSPWTRQPFNIEDYMARHTSSERIIVIGASAGGVDGLRDLMAGLPPDLHASLFIVLRLQFSSSAAGYPSRASLHSVLSAGMMASKSSAMYLCGAARSPLAPRARSRRRQKTPEGESFPVLPSMRFFVGGVTSTAAIHRRCALRDAG